jgi:hypothetical protein
MLAIGRAHHPQVVRTIRTGGNFTACLSMLEAVLEHCLKHGPSILRVSSPWLSRETPKVLRSIAPPNLHWHTSTYLSYRPLLKLSLELS